MAIIKCKMCGGDLNLIEDASTAECEYCGSVQTVPKVDDEKKLTLFARANRLRASCEFDKAAGIYESIVADFPEEAEAYWGLVLCKYGIEYVDDPATGKKIPTCHRSSFDSILEDSDLDMALENADTVAHRLYREEAKQFERIRKGILEVSSTEKPYDIFICYKETDENGDRTIDSVMAQDLYSALTDKGYRVFFSRITLQGKLGEAYEPYIFAALNSAKVMLAVGTRYEYYNAVWVKNEWSRYLKICSADKSKHLIPCYKDLDPEDMPREFNHLQGADLGKMGAVQDILFNMEKYIPLKKETTTVIQQVVSNNVSPLLKRGNMALEDKEWTNAEKFFEDVLNQDAECAEAYIGKALTQAKCGSLDDMVRKEVEKASSEIFALSIKLPKNEEHIRSQVEKYLVPGFLYDKEIEKIYEYDLRYNSCLEAWEQKKQDVLSRWNSNRNITRANQFASGSTSEALNAAFSQLTSMLDENILQAEKAHEISRTNLEKQYEEFLQQTDKIVLEKSDTAKAQREAEYANFEVIANESNNYCELMNTVSILEDMGEYRESVKLKELCLARMRDIETEEKHAQQAESIARKQAKALKDMEKSRNDLKKKVSSLESYIVDLQKDQKKLRNYTICTILTCVFIFVPFPLVFWVLLFVSIFMWNRLWSKYKPQDPKKKIKRRHRVKYIKDYLIEEIDRSNKEIAKLRIQIASDNFSDK